MRGTGNEVKLMAQTWISNAADAHDKLMGD